MHGNRVELGYRGNVLKNNYRDPKSLIMLVSDLIDYVEEIIMLYIFYIVFTIGEFLLLPRLSLSINLLFMCGILFIIFYGILLGILIHMRPPSTKGGHEFVSIRRYLRASILFHIVLVFLVLVSMVSLKYVYIPPSSYVGIYTIANVAVALAIIIIMYFIRTRLIQIISSLYRSA